MAYSEQLAQRIRAILQDDPRIEERKMFGGLAFLLNGHMCCGVLEAELMVRVGPEAYDSCLRESHARAMDFTGKAMRGLLYVNAAGVDPTKSLLKWVKRGVEFAGSLPPKTREFSDERPSIRIRLSPPGTTGTKRPSLRVPRSERIRSELAPNSDSAPRSRRSLKPGR